MSNSFLHHQSKIVDEEGYPVRARGGGSNGTTRFVKSRRPVGLKFSRCVRESEKRSRLGTTEADVIGRRGGERGN